MHKTSMTDCCSFFMVPAFYTLQSILSFSDKDPFMLSVANASGKTQSCIIKLMHYNHIRMQTMFIIVKNGMLSTLKFIWVMSHLL